MRINKLFPQNIENHPVCSIAGVCAGTASPEEKKLLIQEAFHAAKNGNVIFLELVLGSKAMRRMQTHFRRQNIYIQYILSQAVQWFLNESAVKLWEEQLQIVRSHMLDVDRVNEALEKLLHDNSQLYFVERLPESSDRRHNTYYYIADKSELFYSYQHTQACQFSSVTVIPDEDVQNGEGYFFLVTAGELYYRDQEGHREQLMIRDFVNFKKPATK